MSLTQAADQNDREMLVRQNLRTFYQLSRELDAAKQPAFHSRNRCLCFCDKRGQIGFNTASGSQPPPISTRSNCKNTG